MSPYVPTIPRKPFLKEIIRFLGVALLILCALAVGMSVTRADAKPRSKRSQPAIETSWFGSSIVSAARSQIGNGPIYGRRNLWCARFMNVILQRAGYRGTGSDMAKSFAGNPKTSMRVGAIAVMSRGRRGGHVGVVSGISPRGNPIIVSGNHNGRVAETEYPRGRVYAFVEPR